MKRQNSRPGSDEARLRSRIDRVVVRARIPKQKVLKYKYFCLVHELNLQDAVELAMDSLLVNYARLTGAPEPQSPTVTDLSDLDDDDKETPLTFSSNLSLIREAPEPQSLTPAQLKEGEALTFYSNRTRNRTTARDKGKYYEVPKDGSHPISELPLVAIKLGILQSVLLCRTHVNSFAYCFGAIREHAGTGSSEELLNYFLRTWEPRVAEMRKAREEELREIRGEVS
jgi:hypothetical protein